MAGLLACTGLIATPAQAATPDTSGLPDHLVNGDFEYPTTTSLNAQDHRFTYISQSDNTFWLNGDIQNGHYHRQALPAGFDKTRFAWRSTQTGGNDVQHPEAEKPGDVQVWLKGSDSHYAELCAAQEHTSIYQDIQTEPGVAYVWRLRHASVKADYLDKMSVMIGAPGKEQAQEATRITSNGHGDQTGPVGTVISTKVTNHDTLQPDGGMMSDHTGQWETYTGTYIVPAGQSVTRFTFKTIDSIDAYSGNLLDDITFTKAYPLSYDANGGMFTQKPNNQ